jgi:hypothetical protein
MSGFQTEELLILAKTYPIPSKQRRETTCVAAINKSGELRRLYPIPFRFLDGNSQFNKWQWIQANIERDISDRRPESYRVDIDSIIPLNNISTKHGWKDRIDLIEPHILQGFFDLEERRIITNESFGFIRAFNINLDIQKSDHPDWTEEERLSLIKDGLFDSSRVKNRPILKKVPLDFYYKYQCISTDKIITSHRHKINDWEAGAFYWNCVKDYGANWEMYFRRKLETEFSKKDLILMMGNQKRFQDQWLIISLIYPPAKLPDSKNDYQLSFELPA